MTRTPHWISTPSTEDEEYEGDDEEEDGEYGDPDLSGFQVLPLPDDEEFNSIDWDDDDTDIGLAA